MELVFHVLLVGVLASLFIAFFLIPSWIARWRNAEHFGWIVLANLVAGGTGAGWIVVLIWALYDRARTTKW